MNVLVTGATGFIGNHLCKLLTDKGFEVSVLVRPGSDIYKLQQLKNVEFVFGDIQNFENVRKLKQVPQIVFHLAADWSKLDAELDKQFLTYLADNGTKKIIFYSSVCAAGLDYATSPLKEEDVPRFLEKDAYGKYKYGVELFIRELIEKNRIKGVILRPTLVYGPGDTNNIYTLIKAVRHCKLSLWDNGKRIIAPCYIENLNKVALLAATTNEFNDVVYNVADGEGLSTLHVTKVIAYKMGFKFRYTNWSSLFGEKKGFLMFVLNKLKLTNSFATHFAFRVWTRSYDVDLKKLQKALGEIKLASFEEAISDTLNWYLKENII